MPSQPWNNDTLDRQKYADFLASLINSGSGPKIINLNAAWGTGKTFFLENWHSQLRHNENQLTVYFNAWESDFSSDPLLSMLSALNDELMQYSIDAQTVQQIQSLTSKAGQFLKQVSPVIAKALVKKCTGVDTDDLGNPDQDSSDDKELENFVGEATKGLMSLQSDKNQSMIDFRDGLSKLVRKLKDNGLNGPLIVLVDELDRCRPTYAVELLENIKHLFSVPEVTFVVATDSSQLQHTVKALYGEGFDGSEYLRRFFDAEFKLPQPDFSAFSDLLFAEENTFRWLKSDMLCEPDLNGPDIQKTKVLFAQCARAFDLSLRSQIQAVSKIKTIQATHSIEWKSYWLIPLIVMNLKYPETFNSSVVQARSGKEVGTILTEKLPETVCIKLYEEEHSSFDNRYADCPIRDLLTEFFRALAQSCEDDLDLSRVDSRGRNIYGYANKLIDPHHQRSNQANACDYVDAIEMASHLFI